MEMGPKKTHGRFRALKKHEAKPLCEPLESRQLLASISYVYGVLVVTGDWTTANTLSVKKVSSTQINVWASGVYRSISPSQLSYIKLVGGQKNDALYVDQSIAVKSYIWGDAG